MKTIRAYYRDHFIDLEGDAKHEGWRVATIIHSTTKRALSPPAALSPDDLTAEQLAKEAIDRQIEIRPAADWTNIRRQLFPPDTPRG